MNKSTVNVMKGTWRIFKKGKLVLNSMAAAALLLSANIASANDLPTGGDYVSGTGSISSAGSTMDINQSSQYGIINWDSFSIGVDGTVNILNGAGATLSRVTGQSISTILGQLNATGSAYLINENGVVVGENGVITTGGDFVASSLNITNNDFLNGQASRYKGDGNHGQVVNLGRIVTGGNALLLGREVLNQNGKIQAKGNANLAAGNEILVADTSMDGGIYVSLGDVSKVENSGIIEGMNVALHASTSNVLSNAINNTGSIKATGINTEGGRIILSAKGGILENSGSIDASSATGNGGKVILEGNTVNVRGGSNINASGRTGGGEVYVGGGWQGSDPYINNSQKTLVEDGAVISANADVSGDGGRVALWSDNRTEFYGNINARTNSATGHGGNVEVSGKEEFVMASWDIDVYGGAGNGTLLLDPTDINIIDGAQNSIRNTTVGTNSVTDGDVQSWLQNYGSLSIKTSDAGTDAGNINVDSNVDVTWTTTNNLSMTAHNDINLGGKFDASGSLASNIAFRAGRDINVENADIQTGRSGALIMTASADRIDDKGDLRFDNTEGWKTDVGAINFGNNVKLKSRILNMASGKIDNGDDTFDRANLSENVEISNHTGSFGEFRVEGFNNLDLNINNNSELVSENGSVIIKAKNVNIDENHRTIGDYYVDGAAFDPNQDYNSEGWKTNEGTVNVAANTELDLCCHVGITSGLKEGAVERQDMANVDFQYNNTDKTYSSFNVQGFDRFDVDVEGNSLKSATFVNIENKYNFIDFDVKAGVPGKPTVTVEDTNVTVRAGSFDENEVYDPSINNTGTTTFAKAGGGVVEISAGENVIIESGVETDGSRTDFNDANTKLTYAPGAGNQYDGDLKVRGFRDLELNTTDIAGDLNVVGDIDLYASQKITLDENIETFQKVLVDADDNPILDAFGNQQLVDTNILAISENDMELESTAQITTTGDATLVVDEETPTTVGDGKFEMAAAASITTGGNLAIFTSQRSQNNINGTLNGVSFAPGTAFVDTASEQWLTSYTGFVEREAPDGTIFVTTKAANINSPYSVLYKNGPSLNISNVDCETNPELPICSNNVNTLDSREFRVALSQDNTEPEPGALAWGASADIRPAEFYTTLSPDYVDTALRTNERAELLVAVPLSVVDTALFGLALPGIQGIANILTLGASNAIIGSDDS